MNQMAKPVAAVPVTSWLTPFTPKIVTMLREGYTAADFRADALAGLTVAIVALPLSMAIAIGSGLTPERGLFTAVVGGFLISALGGSRHQIGGPAGAFIVLVASIVERHGYDGLVLATMLAGLMMIVAGACKAGRIIHFIPFPVIVGFTAGIAAIIFASQIRDLFGLDLVKEPSALLPKLVALSKVIGTIKPATIALSATGIAIILGLRRWRPKWPAFLIAVVALAAISVLLKLDVATIGSRFGSVPSMLPAPRLPAFDLALVIKVLPDAMAIALLGAIESLLSAVVADGMTRRRHRSNIELVAQGVANVAAVAFGGLCVTGTIARTATNVRAGARTPVAGILHAVYLMLFMLVAAPLAAYIPLAALGAVLAIVAWNMADLDEFKHLIRNSWADAAIVLATFGLTVFWDLTVGIATGVALSVALAARHMRDRVDVSTAADAAMSGDDQARTDGVVVYRISGALHFGATATVTKVLDQVGAHPTLVVLDVSAVRHVDTTAAKAIARFAAKLATGHTRLRIAGARADVRHDLIRAGVRAPIARYVSLADAAPASGTAAAGLP